MKVLRFIIALAFVWAVFAFAHFTGLFAWENNDRFGWMQLPYIYTVSGSTIALFTWATIKARE
jgi:hypothetical protein